MRQRKFTPEKIQQIRDLVQQGKRREQIAELVGAPLGSLQVTCSRLGIRLRRVVPENGTTDPPSVSAPLPPIKEQLQQKAAIPYHGSAKTKDDRPTLALRMQYRGDQRIVELPLAQDVIAQLAFEAQFRGMNIGELVSESITEVIKKDLLQQMLEAIPPTGDSTLKTSAALVPDSRWATRAAADEALPAVEAAGRDDQAFGPLQQVGSCPFGLESTV